MRVASLRGSLAHTLVLLVRSHCTFTRAYANISINAIFALCLGAYHIAFPLCATLRIDKRERVHILLFLSSHALAVSPPIASPRSAASRAFAHTSLACYINGTRFTGSITHQDHSAAGRTSKRKRMDGWNAARSGMALAPSAACALVYVDRRMANGGLRRQAATGITTLVQNIEAA